jgi:hypothetical protein
MSPFPVQSSMRVRSVMLAVGLILVPPAAAAPQAAPPPTQAAGPGQTAPSPAPLVDSLRALKTLLSRIPASTTAIRLDRIRADTFVTQLLDLSAKWPANSPLDYRANLAADVAALEAALNGGNPQRLGATLQAIGDDLEIKLEHCTKSGGKLGGSVVVRVRTVRGSEEIRNWQVFYMPKVLEAAGNTTPDLFPQLSSPTSETIVPGRYAMWLRDPATNAVGARTIVKVGEGKKDLILDLPVPPDAVR